MTIQEALSRSAEALQRDIEKHCRLVSLAEEERAGGEVNLLQPLGRPENGKIKQTLLEAIEVLEDTRKSFKSKQLEQLRKKLLKVLVEIS